MGIRCSDCSCLGCDSDDGATRASAILGLVESVIWSILSLLGLLYSVCAIAPRVNTLLYLVYFYDSECDVQPPTFIQVLSPGWPPDGRLLEPSERTRAFAATRFALSMCRVGLCAALLVVRHKQRYEQFRLGRPSRPYFPVYFAWLVGCGADLLMDVVTATLYALDFYRTTTVRGVMVLLGIDVPDGSAWEALLPSWAKQSPAGPTALLLVLASRAFPLLWIADAVAFVRVTSAARSLQHRFRHFRTEETAPVAGHSQDFSGTVDEQTPSCSHNHASELQQ